MVLYINWNVNTSRTKGFIIKELSFDHQANDS